MNNKHKSQQHIIDCKCGDVYMANLQGKYSEEKGYRPCIICQNNIGNKYSPNVSVIPLTTSTKKIKANMPTHVVIEPSEMNGLSKTSVALCENISNISKRFLSNKVGSLSKQHIQKLFTANLIAIGIVGLLSEKDSYESMICARERVAQYV